MYFFLKKATLNKTLYQTHLKLAKKWGNICYIIADSVHSNLNIEMQSKNKPIQL